ncbi:MAG: insulinase family protein [Kofleriaceae bacterium]
MQQLSRWWSIACLVAACSAPPAPRAAAPTPPPVTPAAPSTPPLAPPAIAEQPLPLWPRVTRGTLPNGLTYYILPNQQPRHRAAMWLAVNAGSMEEDDDQQGLAHFVEHMAFNGTARYPKQAIVDYLEKIGMEFGPDVNAYTSWDQTVYQLQVPTDDPAFVDRGLDILRDWAGAISFDPVEVDKERGVVLEEWRLGRGADERIFTKQAPVLFGGTRYAQRLPIGLPAIITGAPAAAAIRFYRDWYRPDLMAVIVVGDVDVATVERNLAARFGDLVGPAAPRPRATGGALARGTVKIAIDTDPELDGRRVSIEDLFPHRRETYPSDYRKFVLDGLYTRMMEARLTSLARRPDAPFTFAWTATGDSTREFEAFSRTALAKEGRVLDALRVLVTEVARASQHGFTDAELARAKRAYLRSSAEAAAEWDKAASDGYADELTRHFFEGELVIGRVAEDQLAQRYVPEVTVADITAAAAAWTTDTATTVAIAAPPDEPGLPTAAQVSAVLAAARQPVAPWVEEPVPTSLLTTAPAPGKIVDDQPADALGVTRWTLANGAHVVVKPTDFDNQQVYLLASSPGGTAQLTDAQFASGRLATEVAAAGGFGALSADQLDRFLADKQLAQVAWLDETDEGMWLHASAAELPELLQLAHLQLTSPRRDPQAFAAWQAARADGLARRTATPEVALDDELTRVLSGDHPRRRPLTAADVQAVDLDQALAAYRDRFGDAGDFTFTLVGNLDLATLRPLVETYLGSLPATGRRERRKDIGVTPPRGVVTRTVRRGVEPKAAVELVFQDQGTWSAAAAADLALLGAVLELRLHDILREDLSGVYGVAAYGWFAREPVQRHRLTIQFGCAPANVKALTAAVRQEIARLQRVGVDASYLAKVAETKRRHHETELTDNAYWLELLSSAAAMGDDPRDRLARDGDTGAATNARLKAAAKRFLGKTTVVTGVLLPAE